MVADTVEMYTTAPSISATATTNPTAMRRYRLSDGDGCTSRLTAFPPPGLPNLVFFAMDDIIPPLFASIIPRLAKKPNYSNSCRSFIVKNNISRVQIRILIHRGKRRKKCESVVCCHWSICQRIRNPRVQHCDRVWVACNGDDPIFDRCQGSEQWFTVLQTK